MPGKLWARRAVGKNAFAELAFNLAFGRRSVKNSET